MQLVCVAVARPPLTHALIFSFLRFRLVGHFSADLLLVLLYELEVLKVFRPLSPCVT